MKKIVEYISNVSQRSSGQYLQILHQDGREDAKLPISERRGILSFLQRPVAYSRNSKCSNAHLTCQESVPSRKSIVPLIQMLFLCHLGVSTIDDNMVKSPQLRHGYAI